MNYGNVFKLELGFDNKAMGFTNNKSLDMFAWSVLYGKTQSHGNCKNGPKLSTNDIGIIGEVIIR